MSNPFHYLIKPTPQGPEPAPQLVLLSSPGPLHACTFCGEKHPREDLDYGLCPVCTDRAW